MKLPWTENFRWYALVSGLVAALLLLAVLQYRSVKAVSVATSEQMYANLRGSLMDVRQGLERELTPLCRELQFGAGASEQDELHSYALRFGRWRMVSAHPALVTSVYVLQEDQAGSSQLLRLNSDRMTFEPIGWPQDLEKLKDRISGPDGGPPGSPEDEPRPHFGEGGPGGGGGGESPPPMSDGMGPDQAIPPRDFSPREHEGEAQFPSNRNRSLVPPDRPLPFSSWMIDENVPALIHPFVRHIPRDSGRRPGMPPPVQWLIVTLDRKVLGQEIVPELVQRYFGSAEQSSYEIAVIDANAQAQAQPLYGSADLKDEHGVEPDAALNLFGRLFPSVAGGQPARTGNFAPSPENARTRQIHSPGPPDGFNDGRGDGHSVAIEPILYEHSGQEWEIIAKHRSGSVEAAVTALWRRNLMLNFGVLMILAATMAMVISASIRARRFGKLQMDFVANVSHELRTPLTGIVSAAQNMADGLIDDKQKVAIYGKAIVREAEQLSDLVEQILQFSATQKDGDRYHFEPVNIAEVVEFTLKNTATLLQSADIKVEQDIEPGLSPVSADFKALSHCLQNLIGNAVKYGGEQRWIGIRAWASDLPSGGKEICTSVADKGIGIRRQDLNNIFQPFYRTTEVTEAQIHGSGLGLPLAKRIAEAMHGSLTVESEPGQGSIFTVHLPTK